MRNVGVVLLVVLACVACSKPAVNDAAALRMEAAPAAKAKEGAGAPFVGPQLPLLAYSYGDKIEASPSAIPVLIGRHQAACQGAGPGLCQVVAAESRSAGPDGTEATLKLRADPAWLTRFRAGLSDDAKAQGGRVVESTVATEDLTRSIVDTDAALRAKQALETRLEQLLATRTGKLSDLLEVEQELARVQGEIDAAKSELAVMRARVATSELSIGYVSRTPLATAGAWRPVAEASRNAVGLFAQSLAAIVMLVSVALPFLLLGAMIVLGAMAWRRRRPARRYSSSTRADEPPTAPGGG